MFSRPLLVLSFFIPLLYFFVLLADNEISMTPSVAVVILNWNGRKLLEEFLPSVTRFSTGAQIIVADNASNDESVNFLKINYPEVRIIQNDRNYGFAKGYNVALQEVNAEYYILLNSDAEVTESWLDYLIRFMSANPSIGAAQPKIKDRNKKNDFEYAGAAGGFIDKWGYPFCRGRIFNDLETDVGQYDDAKEVFWATGACMAIKSNVFKEAGKFDDDFFAHMEEIDLCWRIKNLGYKIYCVPQSVVYHVGGGTLNKYSPGKTYLNFRNNLMMMIKNLPSKKLFRTILIRLILDGAAAIRFLFDKNGFRHFSAVARAHFYIYSNFGRLKKKRKLLKQKQVHSIYTKSIVYEHFILGKKRFSELNPKDFS